jgi:LPXTG-site transpeptidase (sortase) family protein
MHGQALANRSSGGNAGVRACTRLAGLGLAVALAVAGCAGGSPTPAAPSSTGPHAGIERGVAPPSFAPLLAAMARSRPLSLRVPAIGVRSPLIGLGLAADGTLEVPPGAYPAGWFTGAPTPGELGPAVIAGHVSYNGTDGVFYDLHRLRTGDKVVVRRSDGTAAVFGVTRVEHYAKSRFPSRLVYGDIGHAGLRLITCGGFDAGSDTYRTNVVVFARLDTERTR